MLHAIYPRSYKDSGTTLPIEKIAGICSISPQRVRHLIATSKLRCNREEDTVQLFDLLLFLLRNRITIPSSLLPPKSLRILFFYPMELLRDKRAGKKAYKQIRKSMRQLCNVLSRYCSLLLVDSIPFEKHSGLALLNFMPDIAVLTTLTPPDEKMRAMLRQLAACSSCRMFMLFDQQGGNVMEKKGELPLQILSTRHNRKSLPQELSHFIEEITDS